MSKMIVLFSYELTQGQKFDAKESLGITDFVTMLDDLQYMWSHISAEAEEPDTQPFEEWVSEKAVKGDYVFVQGDYFVTLKLVLFCLKNELIPVYSTTYRCSIENRDEENEVQKTSNFSHVRFRKYIL